MVEPIPDSSPISEFLTNLGLNVRREWLDSCIPLLNNSVPGFSNLTVAGKSQLCFGQFLFSDMNFSAAGGQLPHNVHALHLVHLPGPFVLQVDEIINITRPLRDRYQNAAAGHNRCLKLSMTDGVQRVFGIEYRPIKNLDVLAPAGLKVSIHNVHIRRGLLVLVPEVLEVLGGSVEDLDAARKRLVHEVNKPPRGKKTRAGSRPPLASRATLAAWPSNDNVSDQGHGNSSTSQNLGSSGFSDQGAAFATASVGTRGRVSKNLSVLNVRSNAESNPSLNAVVHQENNMSNARAPIYGDQRERVGEFSAGQNSRPCADPSPSSFVTAGIGTRGRIGEDCFVPNVRQSAQFSPLSNFVMDNEDINMSEVSMPIRGDGRERVVEDFADPSSRPCAELNLSPFVTTGIDTRSRIGESIFVPSVTPNAQSNPSPDADLNLEDVSMYDASHIDDRERVVEASADSSSRPSADPSSSSFVASGVDTRGSSVEILFVSNASSNEESNPSLKPAVDREEINMVEASMPNHGDDRDRVAVIADLSCGTNAEPNLYSNASSDVRDTNIDGEVDNPLILNGGEVPFTYFADLMSKWTTPKDEETPFVQGNIKCFLTGVKGFHFKRRTTYELHVYVDDGSLISEVLIDHNVVQKAIGHLPEEVTAALSSLDNNVVSGMKETMKQFQYFLVNFEGIMLVEINNNSHIPVVLEMNQGCSSSDAWSLLQRLKIFTSPETQHQHSESINPIDISP
ncbi:Recq-mediated genome instability protein [Thalictrum thalictroides]|uniref:RecQ-mediated genome instability protein 1 n=1 Tax=Thalictrum thalictroides TaxID=46969 RepID=A0A7J6X9T5_THATH|nr:Recq-mediated genome instability protein [Thalictrum thalictroides]